MNNKLQVLLKPVRKFCGVQSVCIREDAAAGLLEESVISYGDHSRKEYYRGRGTQRNPQNASVTKWSALER
jgi:hypothetical protein